MSDRRRTAYEATSYVLCVEDEVLLGRSILRLLARGGHRGHLAGGVSTARAAFRQLGPPAVLLADLHLPDGSGVELLAEVARLHVQTVGILMTAHPDMDSMLSCLNIARPRSYLMKPFDDDELLRVVDGAMAEHLVRAELVDARRRLGLGDERRRAVYVRDLAESMVLDADVVRSDGLLLAPRGAPLTRELIERLVTVARGRGVKEPLLVREPSAA